MKFSFFAGFLRLIFADWTKNNTKSNKKRNIQQIIPAKAVSDISVGCGWYFLQTIWRNDSPSYSSIVNIITIEKKLLFLQRILNLYFSSSITSLFTDSIFITPQSGETKHYKRSIPF